MTPETETALTKLRSLREAFEKAVPPGEASNFRSLALAATMAVRCLEQGADDFASYWVNAMKDQCTEEPYASQVQAVAHALNLN